MVRHSRDSQLEDQLDKTKEVTDLEFTATVRQGLPICGGAGPLPPSAGPDGFAVKPARSGQS